MKIGICDDESLHVKINVKYIKEYGITRNLDLELMGFTSTEQLFCYLKNNTLDLLLLDIDLGSASGIDAAMKLYHSKPDLLIIFVTGHREFAYEAFDLDALGYVLKPINPDKLAHTLDKAIQKLTAAAANTLAEAYLVIPQESGKKKLYHHEILYITREHAKTVITTKTRSYPLYESITSLMEKLSNSFIRINQGEIVNLKEIQDIKGTTILLSDDTEKNISRSYKKDVLKAYFEL